MYDFRLYLSYSDTYSSLQQRAEVEEERLNMKPHKNAKSER